jgi:predicted site-specific integrase-resolvase
MKLSDWARKNGLDYKTAYRLYRSGRFPLPTEQLPTGTILVHELPSKTNQAVALCAGVIIRSEGGFKTATSTVFQYL